MIESWFPKSFKLNDEITLKRVLFAGVNWQIYRANEEKNILCVNDKLLSFWANLGIVKTKFKEFLQGEQKFYYFVSSDEFVLKPICCDLNQNTTNKLLTYEDAVNFAKSLSNTRNLGIKDSLENSIYIEEMKILLPIPEKKNNANYSSEKYKFFMTTNDEKNIFKLRKKHKNDIKKKFKNKIFEKGNENTFIKVNKLNNIQKNRTCLNDKNNMSFASLNYFGSNTIYNSNFLNNKENLQYNNNTNNNLYYNSNYNINNAINNREYIINQKSELIHRISRVLKAQKDKKEKKKSYEKIRVNQKCNIKNIKRNLNNKKLNFTREKSISPKENEKERYRNRSYTQIKINEAKNIVEHVGRNIIPIKDLINIPFGKKRRILEIFKKNNFSSKSVSPDIKRLFRISSEPIISIKK